MLEGSIESGFWIENVVFMSDGFEFGPIRFDAELFWLLFKFWWIVVALFMLLFKVIELKLEVVFKLFDWFGS